MPVFKLPADLQHNREIIADPSAYLEQSGCRSWLYLIGDEFASMPGGMTWKQVQDATPDHARVISDPPRVLDMELAHQQVEALDALPRPTLVTCRSGPRASAVVYMYAGLREGASAEEVLAAAEADGAPFMKFPEYREWVIKALEALQLTR